MKRDDQLTEEQEAAAMGDREAPTPVDGSPKPAPPPAPPLKRLDGLAPLQALIERLARFQHDQMQRGRSTIFNYMAGGHHGNHDAQDDDSFWHFEQCSHPDCLEAKALLRAGPEPQQTESGLNHYWTVDPANANRCAVCGDGPFGIHRFQSPPASVPPSEVLAPEIASAVHSKAGG